MDYLDEMKTLQRTNRQFREAWQHHCDEELGGTRDPQYHYPDVLKTFLDWWKNESANTAESESGLVEQAKEVQRSGPKGRRSWAAHCESMDYPHNPARHDDNSLHAFMDWWHAKGVHEPDPEPQADDKASQSIWKLAKRVKQMQSSNAEAKELWTTYCDTECDGVRDPVKHDEAGLKGFLAQFEEAQHADRADANLVGRVKDVQRSCAAGKNAWKAHCEEKGARADPAWHDNASLQAFLDWWNSEAQQSEEQQSEEQQPDGPSEIDKEQLEWEKLVREVKQLRASSKHARIAWARHCEAECNGLKDPARHEISTLDMFLKSWQTKGQYVLQINQLLESDSAAKIAWTSHCQTELDGVEDPSRHRGVVLCDFLEWWSREWETQSKIVESKVVEIPNDDVAPKPTKGASKELVRKMRSYMKDHAFKAAWNSYCDEHFGGVRNPVHHDNEALTAYLELWDSEPLENPEKNKQKNGDLHSGPSLVEISETPSKDLVQRIRLIQRSSPDGKQAWLNYCRDELDGTIEPSRLDSTLLTLFLDWWDLEGAAALNANIKPVLKTASSSSVPTPTRPVKRPADSTPEGERPQKKVTIKKSVVDAISAINSSGSVYPPIRLGSVVSSLAVLDTAVSIQILDNLRGQAVKDPTVWIQMEAAKRSITG